MLGALQIPGYFLVCDGSHWNLFESFTGAGNVGIGTTAPATRLDVAGTVRVANGGETCSSIIKGGIRYTSTNALQYCNAASWVTIASAGTSPAASPSRGIQFNSGGVLAASSALTYTSAGRLGIGTAAPTYLLDVNPSAASPSQNLFRIADQNGNYISITDGTYVNLAPVNGAVIGGQLFTGVASQCGDAHSICDAQNTGDKITWWNVSNNLTVAASGSVVLSPTGAVILGTGEARRNARRLYAPRPERKQARTSRAVL